MIEVYDASNNSAGIVSREEAHQHGLWHRTAHVWVIHPEYEGGAVLFQLRSDTKTIAPGYLDVTVGGHLDPGETPRDGAIRETKEELRIEVRPDVLIPLGLRQTAGVFGDSTDCEFQNLFGLISSRDPADYTIDRQEVAGLVLIPIKTAIGLFRDEISEYRCLLQSPEENGSRKLAVRKERFIPSQDNYFLRACLAADRILNGDTNTLI